MISSSKISIEINEPLVITAKNGILIINELLNRPTFSRAFDFPISLEVEIDRISIYERFDEESIHPVRALRAAAWSGPGNSEAEWEDLTDSVDFKVTDNGSVSFMTNVSARFWVVQIINESDTNLVESLASDVYKEAIKEPKLESARSRD